MAQAETMRAATTGLSSLVAACAVLAALAACSIDPAAGPAPAAPSASTAPAPPPAQAAVPDIPVNSADLDAQAPVPVAPVRIAIPALGIDMAVLPMGLDPSGAMGLPANPAEAGWYRHGAWPGSASGATVIAAHVDSLYYELGPLARLGDATPGMAIVVTSADGSERRYAVAEDGLISKPEVPWADVFDRSGPSSLVVVTCGGEFDYERRSYLSNVIVTALPEQ